ncbi:hypothetical protein H2203_006784 [Taxawa tesnikishii (nom. ined.)]|nr:hypothetical protein H2203_006784 [Dothideales sp. JES 119]
MLLSFLPLVIPVAAAVTVYQPNETYAVHSIINEVTDNSRTYMGQPWRVMTTTYYPIGLRSSCIPYLVPYMPTLTAESIAQAYGAEYGFPIPNDTFTSLDLQVCNSSSYAEEHQTRRWPLTILSSGAGAVRQIYSALAEELASRGYIVITLDDPGQAAIIEYPDGSYVTTTNLTADTDAQLLSNLANRTADITLVKQRALAGDLLPCSVKVDRWRMAVWGHSFGGAASAQVMTSDASFKGGVNFDGTMYGSVVQTGLARPFLLWGRVGDNASSVPSWAEFLQNSPNRSNKLELTLTDSVHLTFSDAPLVADLTGLAAVPGASALVGGLDGRRALVILATYVDAFFRFSFGEGVPKILQGATAAFPEVEFYSKPLAA